MLSTTTEPKPSPPAGPLDAMELQRLTRAIRGLSRTQLIWAGGYLADIARTHGGLSDEDARECVENLRAEGRAEVRNPAEDFHDPT